MKNKIWIVFMVMSIVFACAAGYLFVTYQHQGIEAEQAMTNLRSIRDSAKTESPEDTAKVEDEKAVFTAAPLSVPDDGEPEALETQIPVDYTGFDEPEDQAPAEATAIPATQQITLTAAKPSAEGDALAEETSEATDKPQAIDASVEAPSVTETETPNVETVETVAATETKSPETAVPSQETPAPAATEDTTIDELILRTATATAKVEYSLNTVVPSSSEEAMPTNWVSKEKYILKEEDILPEYKELYEINNEMVGWLTIEGTKIDYPVVQTDNPDFYLKHDFYGKNNANGMLIVTSEYDVLTPSQNILIHGHNMRNGKMFNNLQNYASESFFTKHQYIKFDTLTEHRTYQVVSAFYTRIYDADEPGFRYNVVLGDNIEVTKYFLNGIRENAAYDTGVYFDRYDEFLELSTCAYHAREGRFVVVAKRVS